MIVYRLVRSNRKTLTLSVTKYGNVEVRAPQRLAQEVIDRFVKQKEGWILSHQRRIAQQAGQCRTLLSQPAAQLLYLGQRYPVRPDDQVRFDGQAFWLPRAALRENLSEVVKLYRSLAAPLLQQRVVLWSPVVGKRPCSVRVGNAATRWGSCSGKGRLNFTWRLILAPLNCVDYVVIHELCHLKHPNHSDAFWQEVQRCCPRFLDGKQQLQALLQDPLFGCFDAPLV